ncbi:MAG: hypothetical protein J6I73_03025 [Treponema sp.]|nr:hypothetical protein [Treponema sp.]
MRNKWTATVLLALCIACCSCVSNFFSRTPYRMQGEVSLESDTSCAGIALALYNASGKTIERFSVVIFLCDYIEDDVHSSNCITAVFESDIAAGETAQFWFSIDDCIADEADTSDDSARDGEAAYQIDFMYVDRIEYDDGSVWMDEYGMYASS